MTLFEHLAELRSRLFKAVIAIVLGTIGAWFFKDQLFDLMADPLNSAVSSLNDEKPGLDVKLNLASITTPLMLFLKISLVAGLIVTCPVWLYQLWAFVVPGLRSNERKWTRVFVGAAAPLFVAGIAVGYYVIPKGFEVLLGFTPESVDTAAGVVNIIRADELMSQMLRILLVFGVGFLLPVAVVLLNLVGVLSARRLAKWRAGIVFGIFVFAAVATPSVDPITMLFLAGPMCVLFLAAEITARLIERGRRQRMADEDPDLVVYGDDD